MKLFPHRSLADSFSRSYYEYLNTPNIIGIGSTCMFRNIVAAGMHASPAKHNYAVLLKKCDRHTDGRTDAGQSDFYVPLCFAGDTKSALKIDLLLCHRNEQFFQLESKTRVINCVAILVIKTYINL